jgi:hypothetical protein
MNQAKKYRCGVWVVLFGGNFGFKHLFQHGKEKMFPIQSIKIPYRFLPFQEQLIIQKYFEMI